MVTINVKRLQDLAWLIRIHEKQILVRNGKPRTKQGHSINSSSACPKSVMMLRFIHLCICIYSLCNMVGGFLLFTAPKQRHCMFMSTKPSKNKRPLILGVNKYSHDTSCCFVDGNTGEILLAQAKERLTGSKHDGGGINSIVKVGLESLGASIDDITTVISNNHHYRVQPFEKRLPFSSKMRYTPNSYLHDHNLLPKSKHLELSHHLAHAWSGIAGAPFRKGLIVVMDGMGESYRAMIEDMLGVEPNSGDYMHDLKLLKAYGADGFIGQPLSLIPGSGYREAETAYIFDADKGLLKPVYKRWSRERSPSELYNHGFENMESLGMHLVSICFFDSSLLCVFVILQSILS